MNNSYILAIDQGTGGTRVIIFNHGTEIKSIAYKETVPIYPLPGWVEHDPLEIWSSVVSCMEEALRRGEINPKKIKAIGVTNQRESVVLWDRKTGEPISNSINWQCRRTSSMCKKYRINGYEKTIKSKTGLIIDPYFSATKIRWAIENIQGVKKKIERKEVCVGTIDSWIIWNLSGGISHVTDYSNASRTLLFDIYSSEWDEELLTLFDIPRYILPTVHPSSGIMAHTSRAVFYGEEIPIAGNAGDQHAALFGQCCFTPGMLKCTFGTALSVILNTGREPIVSDHGLLTNLTWRIGEDTTYGLEGTVYSGGAVIRWLRDGLKIISRPSDTSDLAESVPNTGGVYIVPALNGLCAPYWDSKARGLIIGITAGTSVAHIVRSALESSAYQTRDIIQVMEQEIEKKIYLLRADGGASKSVFLMQFLADILGIPIQVPTITEMTALGVCYLAGLGIGFWNDTEELQKNWKLERQYEPRMEVARREELYDGWKRAVKRSMNWSNL